MCLNNRGPTFYLFLLSFAGIRQFSQKNVRCYKKKYQTRNLAIANRSCIMCAYEVTTVNVQ